MVWEECNASASSLPLPRSLYTFFCCFVLVLVIEFLTGKTTNQKKLLPKGEQS